MCACASASTRPPARSARSSSPRRPRRPWPGPCSRAPCGPPHAVAGSGRASGRRRGDASADRRQRRSHGELDTTLTLLNAMAAPATTGSNRLKAASRRHEPRVAVHQGDGGGGHRHVGAGRHRGADIGGGERRRVVDAAADPGHHLAGGTQRLHRRRLVAGQHAGAEVVDARFERDRLGVAMVVAGSRLSATVCPGECIGTSGSTVSKTWRVGLRHRLPDNADARFASPMTRR